MKLNLSGFFHKHNQKSHNQFENKMETEQLDASGYFRSIRKLYFFSQLCGFASFSYSPKIGVHLTIVNVLMSSIFTIFYWILIIGNAIIHMNVIGTVGYKMILFYVGLRLFAYYTLTFMWLIIGCLYLVKKRISKLMEEFIELECEVRQCFTNKNPKKKKTDNNSNFR